AKLTLFHWTYWVAPTWPLVSGGTALTKYPGMPALTPRNLSPVAAGADARRLGDICRRPSSLVTSVGRCGWGGSNFSSSAPRRGGGMTFIVRSGGVRTACTRAMGGGPAYGAVGNGPFSAGRMPIGMDGAGGAFGFWRPLPGPAAARAVQ